LMLLQVLLVEWERDRSSIVQKVVTITPMMTTTMTYLITSIVIITVMMHLLLVLAVVELGDECLQGLRRIRIGAVLMLLQVLVVEWERERDRSSIVLKVVTITPIKTTTMTYLITTAVMITVMMHMLLVLAVVELGLPSKHLQDLVVVLSMVPVTSSKCIQGLRIRRIMAVLMLQVLVVEWERDRSSIALKVVTVMPM
jgi:hypothetical protein